MFSSTAHFSAIVMSSWGWWTRKMGPPSRERSATLTAALDAWGCRPHSCTAGGPRPPLPDAARRAVRRTSRRCSPALLVRRAAYQKGVTWLVLRRAVVLDRMTCVQLRRRTAALQEEPATAGDRHSPTPPENHAQNNHCSSLGRELAMHTACTWPRPWQGCWSPHHQPTGFLYDERME